MIKSSLVCLGIFVLLSSVNGQELVPGSKMMVALNFMENYVPEKLLSTKTIVIVTAKGRDSESGIRSSWKSVAEEAHPHIIRLGIDPVMYYYYDDMVAGPDISKKIILELVKRDIENIILIGKDNSKPVAGYTIAVSEFNKKLSLMSQGQEALKIEGNDLANMFRSLARIIDRKDLKRENYLMLDIPEYFDDWNVIDGNRFEVYNRDVRIDKLLVPAFRDIAIPNTIPDGNEMKTFIQSDNKKNIQRNSQIESIFQGYPFDFKIDDYSYNEKSLLNNGYQFVLLRLETTGENLKKMLGYPVDDGKGLQIMKRDINGNITMQSIPLNTTIYKYYIKHINSEDIYLGNVWDADVTWEGALRNHIEGLVSELTQGQGKPE